VPWLYFISIDIFSTLITLMPTIEMSRVLHPCYICSISTIFIVLSRSRRIEYIYGKSELVFAISRWGAEGSIAPSEIPESLLVLGTPISTDDDEISVELSRESFTEIFECIYCFYPEASEPSCLIDILEYTYFCEIRRRIARIVESGISRRECVDTRVISRWE
jgi:hypothetical protein